MKKEKIIEIQKYDDHLISKIAYLEDFIYDIVGMKIAKPISNKLDYITIDKLNALLNNLDNLKPYYFFIKEKDVEQVKSILAEKYKSMLIDILNTKIDKIKRKSINDLWRNSNILI